MQTYKETDMKKNPTDSLLAFGYLTF